MKKITILGILLFVLLLQASTGAQAHGSGISHEEQKNGYFIDIGYDQEFPIAQDSLRFDFVTYPEDRGSIEGEVFTDVWVRISQDRELFFSGGINKPVFGATGFTYMFPREGTYEVFARFQNDGETVVETSFTINVLPMVIEEEVSWLGLVGAGSAGFVLGAGGMLLLRRKTKVVV
jgi:hypothetical protein